MLFRSQAAAERRLRAIPGVGVWTAAEVRQRAHGDPDAVSFGDYHIAKDVGWALAGLRRPRHGPRMAPRTHLPTGSAR